MITVIGNLKGGTGKSTVTFNLAVWLCLTEGEVTVIDLDPQKTLSDVAALRAEERIEPAIHVQSGPFSNARLPKGAQETLIDVGTADLKSFKQALAIADRVVIPVTPSQADIWSTQRFVQFLGKVRHGNPPESITFINRSETNQAIQASDEAAAALTALPGVRLIPQRLCDRAVFRNSFSEGLAVFELEPRSRASAEFRTLAAALFTRNRFATATPLEIETASASAGTSRQKVLHAASADQTAQKPDENGVGLAATATGTDDSGENRKKHKTGEDKKARKGKKHKHHKKGLKEKHAKKGHKDKKNKKAREGKKGKREKKGRKTKKDS
jgi:chromosome partitioning protein